MSFLHIPYVSHSCGIFWQTVLILGVSGACRREELLKMMVDDVEDTGSVLIVKIPDSKTHSERTFTVTNPEYIDIFRKYMVLRPPHTSSRRLFYKYSNGKCANQHVGINKIGGIPSLIANWLGKEMFHQYTGHCFRRSSATLLANAGGNMTSIKRHGGWKSATVAEGYIEDSLNNKIDISNKIFNCQPSTSKVTMPDEAIENQLQPCSSETDTFNVKNMLKETIDCKLSGPSGIKVGENCSNCTINVNFHIT